MTTYVYLIDEDTGRRWCAGFGATREEAMANSARTLANINEVSIEDAYAIIRGEQKLGLLSFAEDK
jgi:hypothetical protein